MVRKLTAVMALIPATFAVANPAYAADTITGFNAPNNTSTMFFVSIPLDGKSRKERETGYGLALQGKEKAFVMDTRTLKNNFGIETLAGLELKWIIAGAAAVATAAAVGTSSSSRSEAQAVSQAQQTNALAASSTGATTLGSTSSGTTSAGTSSGTVTASSSRAPISATGASTGVTSPGVEPCTIKPTC